VSTARKQFQSDDEDEYEVTIDGSDTIDDTTMIRGKHLRREEAKERKFLRLAIGARSQQCRVAEGFRVVVVVEKTQAYNELDLPLLNRFEKQVMCHDDMLESEVQKRLKKGLVLWLRAVQRECGADALEDIFTGYFQNSAASLVMSRTKKGSTHEGTVLEQMKAELADAAQPMCVLKSKLLGKGGGKLWQATVRTDAHADGYFRRHESLSTITSDLVGSLREEGEGADTGMREHLQAVVVTKSPQNHLPGNEKKGYKKLGLMLGYDDEPDLVRLAEFSISHELRANLAKVILTEDGGGRAQWRLLVVQCDLSQCHCAAINHAKRLCQELVYRQAGRDIIFVIHTPPRANGTSEEHSYKLDYETGWHHVFIDDIREVGTRLEATAPRLTRTRSATTLEARFGIITPEYRQWHQFVQLDRNGKFLLGADKEELIRLLNLSDPAPLAFMDRRLMIVCRAIKSPERPRGSHTGLQEIVQNLLDSTCKNEFLQEIADATAKVVLAAGKRQVIDRDGASTLAYSGSSREYVMSMLYSLVELALAKVIAWSHRNFGLECLRQRDGWPEIDCNKFAAWAKLLRNRSIFGTKEATILTRSFPSDVSGMAQLAASVHECINDGDEEVKCLSAKVPLSNALLNSFRKQKANSARTLIERLQRLSKSIQIAFADNELGNLDHKEYHRDQYHDILHLEISNSEVGEFRYQFSPYTEILQKLVLDRLGYTQLCRGERAVFITGGPHKSQRGTLKQPVASIGKDAVYTITLDEEGSSTEVKGLHFNMDFQRTDFFTEALIGWWAHESEISYLFEILEENPSVRDDWATRKGILEATDLAEVVGAVVLRILDSWIDEGKKILCEAKEYSSATTQWASKTNRHRGHVERLIDATLLWDNGGSETTPHQVGDETGHSAWRSIVRRQKQPNGVSSEELRRKFTLLGVMNVLVEEMGVTAVHSDTVKVKKSECEKLLANEPQTNGFFSQLKVLLQEAVSLAKDARRVSRCLRRMVLEVMHSASTVRIGGQEECHLETLQQLHSETLQHIGGNFDTEAARSSIAQGTLLPEWAVVSEMCELVKGTSNIHEALCSAELRKALLQAMLAINPADPQGLMIKFVKKELSNYATDPKQWINLAPVVSVIVERGIASLERVHRSPHTESDPRAPAIKMIRSGVLEGEPTGKRVTVSLDGETDQRIVPVGSLIQSPERRTRGGKLNAGEEVKVNMLRKHLEDASRPAVPFL
jgi:hypothetical protein